jgi:hypothetical protein
MPSHHELSLVSPLAGMLREALPLPGINTRSVDQGLMQGRLLRSRAAHRLMVRLSDGLRRFREQRRLQRQQWHNYRLYLSLDDHVLRDLGLERDQVVSMLLDENPTTNH